MFEYHGWATIVDSAAYDDVADDPAEATLDEVREAIEHAHMETVASLEFRHLRWYLTIMGHSNQRNPGVVSLFETVARVAPGSYGLLYTHDDEANLSWSREASADEVGEDSERWYCRVMHGGRVERHDDPFLTPLGQNDGASRQ
jgi:hypothetical protein